MSVFRQMSEFLSTVIKKCRANFEAKWQVFMSISILVQECHYFMKKIDILGEMLTFSLSVYYYWKWLSFCKICLFLEKCDFLSDGLYTLIKCQILKKYSIS